MERLISALGLVVMVALAWLMSSQRRRINWGLVGGGLLLQFSFALLILHTTPGRYLFETLGNVFQAIIGSVEAGAGFLFALNAPPGDTGEAPRLMLLGTFAFGVLPTIVFFSSLMAILYHLGIMQRIVTVLAWILQRTLRTSAAESLSAAANIFAGQTEAPLVIRPYVAKMTLSELNAVMVGGFATIAGGVMAAYVQLGINPGHLMTASVISAPAALLIAKVMEPETEVPQTLGGHVDPPPMQPTANLLEAAAAGATDGLKLALNVAAMLISFLALIELTNLLVNWTGQQFGFVQQQSWSLEKLLGIIFWPFAWLLGVPGEDCFRAGQLLGLKIVTNEFLAYDALSDWLGQSQHGPQPRTVLLMTYALSGFANFGSIGIQIGGISAIAPERRSDLARLGLRAMIGGTLAAMMTACVAGILLGD